MAARLSIKSGQMSTFFVCIDDRQYGNFII